MNTRKITPAIFVAMVALFLSACGAPIRPTPVPPTLTPTPLDTPTQTTTPVPPTATSVPPTLTPTPVILADTFFIGCAFLDENANGQVDNEDAPIEGMRFMATLSGGVGFGDITSNANGGCGVAIVPGALPREAWPVVMQMEIPQTFAYVPVGDVKIVLAYPDTRADFLFSQP